MTSLLLVNCRVVACMDDAGTELRGASIGIKDGWIEQIEGSDPGGEWDERRDCSNSIVLPGFVNTHHHLYQTLTRAFPESEGQTLFAWLQMLYPIWAGLDEDMIHASTRAGLAELALSGCTTVADHLYVFPPGSEHFIDAEVEAAEEIGLRFHPTRGSMDLGQSAGGLPPDSVVQPIDQIIADTERVIDRYHDGSPGAMVRIGVAPCSPFSVSAELMKVSAELARERNVRLHTHIAETVDEDDYSRRVYGVSPIELLERVGWLHPDVWLAHCVHLSDTDMDRMAGGSVCVAHCPTSNMLLGSGLAPTAALRRLGVRIGLGVDGSASNDSNDLRQEVKQAVLSARVRDGASALSVRQALWMATRGGAACLGREDIGRIEAGAVADLVLFDADALPHAGGAPDLIAAVVLGSSRPTTVIVHGRKVVHEGQLATANVHEVAREHNVQAERLLNAWPGRN